MLGPVCPAPVSRAGQLQPVALGGYWGDLGYVMLRSRQQLTARRLFARRSACSPLVPDVA